MERKEFKNICRRNYLPREYGNEMLLTKQEKKLYCPHDYIEVARHVQVHRTIETCVSGKGQKYSQC